MSDAVTSSWYLPALPVLTLLRVPNVRALIAFHLGGCRRAARRTYRDLNTERDTVGAICKAPGLAARRRRVAGRKGFRERVRRSLGSVVARGGGSATIGGRRAMVRHRRVGAGTLHRRRGTPARRHRNSRS